jgi:hypothetical protein
MSQSAARVQGSRDRSEVQAFLSESSPGPVVAFLVGALFIGDVAVALSMLGALA